MAKISDDTPEVVKCSRCPKPAVYRGYWAVCLETISTKERRFWTSVRDLDPTPLCEECAESFINR